MTNILIFMTAPSKREAQKIVRALLDKRLIACANIFGPVDSEFWWQGKIERAKEFLVLMKSDEKLFDGLSTTIKELHSYEVPEILALPIVKGRKLYLEWLNSTLSQS